MFHLLGIALDFLCNYKKQRLYKLYVKKLVFVPLPHFQGGYTGIPPFRTPATCKTFDLLSHDCRICFATSCSEKELIYFLEVFWGILSLKSISKVINKSFTSVWLEGQL